MRQQLANKRTLQTQDAIIYALAYQASLRDVETGRHIERTSAYVEVLARELSKSPRYGQYLSEQYISDIIKAAPLHDVGKVGVPDAILCKPENLTESERMMMQQHAEIGERLLKEADKKVPFQSFLKIAIQLSAAHHERWDGTGYPRGLAGQDIPISARIMAVADVYDALRTERPYKKAFDHETSAKIIMSDKGKLFDPDIVDAFMVREKDFLSISLRLADASLQISQDRFASLPAGLEQQPG
jgi:response regulator RpfG family c-di-GMP phosphodiesterase